MKYKNSQTKTQKSIYFYDLSCYVKNWANHVKSIYALGTFIIEKKQLSSRNISQPKFTLCDPKNNDQIISTKYYKLTYILHNNV